jgi:hypothetical protein
MPSAAPHSQTRSDYSVAQPELSPDFGGPDDSDPLETGRGLVIGVLLSSIFLGGLVALAMLIWLP